MLSTRFGGLDGVSLESKKLAAVLRDSGHQVVWFGGWLAPEFAPGLVTAAADFHSDENRALQNRIFDSSLHDLEAEATIAERAEALQAHIHDFLETFSVDVLVAHNVLSLPLQVPLAVALSDVIEETGIPVVAHHHDWWFERPGMEVVSVPGLMVRSFPPRLDNVEHLVINSIAADQLGERFGIGSTLLPNVMDFDHGFPAGDRTTFRERAKIDPGDTILLQPTRLIPRKGIESTLELAAGLRGRVRVLATHAEDIHWPYWHQLVDLARSLHVDLRFVPARSESDLVSAYAASDLVCFPSVREGFGNALLEAFFHRRPVLVNRYDVYVRDIAPTGVSCIEIDGEVTTDTLSQATAILSDEAAAREMTDANYRIGEEHFSYRVLRERFLPLVEASVAR